MLHLSPFRRRLLGVLVWGLTLSLAGCTLGQNAQSTASTSPTGSATAAASATMSAEQASFRAALESVAGDALPSARDIVDALRDAGFETAQIEVSPDKTPTGLTPDSMWVSVRESADTCLIGQFIQGVQIEEAPPINGRCLIGETLTID